MSIRWDKVNAIYQIYPRSFKDSNSDGIGDIRGIIQKLDYLKGAERSLGVDSIWLSPFYPSPMKDFGYDVKDFCSVDPLFGTIKDIDDLIREAHQRAIAVMVDFVPNHTSSDHPWFIDAVQSRTSDKRDYYIFRDPQEDGSEPNNWRSVFGGSAWEYHEPTGQYYMHSFLKEQPDLNWENPIVQDEMRQVLRFWFDRGIDGIRADAIRWMGKNTALLDDPINDAYSPEQDPYHAVEHHYSRYSPELDDYLRIITEVAREYDNKIVIFEDHLDALTPVESQVKRIYSIDPGVSAPFNFQGMHIPFASRSFSDMITAYQGYLPEDARAYYCFSNHDESRLATRFGARQARMLALLQCSLPGTPVIYYGQEIGMTDSSISKEQVRDPFEIRVPGKGLGRDPERSPMQWSSEHQADFTDAEHSWLPVSSEYRAVNVTEQKNDDSSSLSLYRTLLSLRSRFETLRSGSYEHGHTDENVFMFWRHGATERFLCAVNFSDQFVAIQTPPGGEIMAYAQLGAVNHVTEHSMSLGPFDGMLVRYTI